MNDFLNPYIAGAPVVEPSMFFGRQDIFDWIEQNLSGRFVNHILVIHGQRRVGKTSVLKQIPNHLPSNFIHVFFDLQGRTHTSLDRFQWWLAREICRAVNQRSEEPIPIPEHDLFVQDGEYLAATFLPEVLSKLGETILLLTFDEFDTLSDPEIQQSLTKPLITFLRRLFDLPNLNFIFSIGSSGHKLENMQASYTDFFKTALYRKISFLKQEDCSHLITRPVDGLLTYEPSAVERIYTITSGHPYFTQLICHELFSLSQKTGRRNLTREDVESVLEDVIERGTVNLKFVWDEASDLEKWVLSSLAHELQAQRLEQPTKGMHGQPLCTDKQLASALHSQHVRYSENDLNTALVHLREKDVLTQENRFVVELLCIWLVKNRPLDRVREELVQANPIANRYNEIGDEFHSLGQPEKAMESFRQALSTDPSNLRALVSIANLHLEGGSYDQAVQGYEAALRIDEDDITARSGLCTAFIALGEIAVAAGKIEEAEGHYQRILTINPDYPEVHLRLAGLYSRQADEALASGDAELALRYYPLALEHAPEDSQLLARYANAKDEHTKRLINELLKQSQQAQDQQEWETALDAMQRALQLAPSDPALLNRLTTLKDASRLAKISSLRVHAQEMERLERWKEAIQEWEACLLLHPEDEAAVQGALEHAHRMHKIASDYNQAQAAIKEGRYSQAIALLQAVIAQDATYKDAAKLLVDCLKKRPKQMLKLPVRWLRWTLPIFLLIAAIVGIITQWSHLSPLLAGIGQPKMAIATQAAEVTPPPTLTAGEIPPSTATATGQDVQLFSMWLEKWTGGRAPDFQDDFSSATLSEYWANDGAHAGSLQDGVLQLENGTLIGDATLNNMNYILQVDLRFTGISSNDAFIYEFRLTPIAEKYKTYYTLKIETSNGNTSLAVNNDPQGQFTQLNGMNLFSLQPERWYELGIVVKDQTIAIFLDDKEILIQDNIELFGLINDFGLITSNAEASLDIDNWRLWKLDTPAYMRNDWITSAAPTVEVDNFMEGQGWQFNPQEIGKFENGRAVLVTPSGAGTSFTRDDLQGTNLAMEVTFSPRQISDSSSLEWFLASNKTTESLYAFKYFPNTGFWQIHKVENGVWTLEASGWTQATLKNTTGKIMVVVNGGRVNAFYEDVFFGYVDSNITQAGTRNELFLNTLGAYTAQVDIVEIRVWNLDAVEWTTDDWITARPETVVINSFTGKEGLKFNPVENEKYEDGKAVLFSNSAGETELTRDDLQGKNVALEVSFIPRDISDSSYLVWFLGQDTTTKDRLEFTYSPKTSSWWIGRGDTQQWEVLSSGTVSPTREDNAVTIMVVTDADQVRAYLNQVYIGSANIDRSGAGSWNALVIRNKENLYARYDIYLIRFWDLGSGGQTSGEGAAASAVSASLAESIKQLTGDRAPDFMDDFESAILNEYWANDQGAQEATLQDGALRLGNKNLIGKDTLNNMNYILQVDLRFGGLTGDEDFDYYLRVTSSPYEDATQYWLTINPSSGHWSLQVTTEFGGRWKEILSGNLEAIEAGRWYELGLVVQNESFWVYWEGQQIITQNNVSIFGTINCLGLEPSSAGEATLDIDNWRFWDLGTPSWMRNDWITSAAPTVAVDNFEAGQGWQFSPQENEKYEDGMALLFTNGGETGLTREDIHGTNFAMEVYFKAVNMPETASVVFFLRKDTSTSESLEFEYLPTTGFWQIKWTESKNNLVLASGWTQPTPQDNTGTIMVLVDGNRVSAFYADTFLGYAESNNPVAGTRNELVIRKDKAGYAQVDIEKISYWDLDAPEMMIPERINLRTPTVDEDNFVPGEGWIFAPAENEKYEAGRAILFTNGGHTNLTRDDLQGSNFALEVSFIPRNMPDSATLGWAMRKNNSGDGFTFNISTETGFWQINRIENGVFNLLAYDSTHPLPQDVLNQITVIVNGEYISAFLGDELLATVESSLAGAGTNNEIYVDSGGSQAQVDIISLRFWNLDQ